MGLIDDELSELRKLCEHVIAGSRLVSCVQSQVRAEIKRTPYKTVVVCIQFPVDYPNSPILLELKSKTLSQQLLAKLTDVCEQEAKKFLGKPQVLKTLNFVRNFVDENPLSCCYDEIANVKKLLGEFDELKLRQKSSSLNLRLKNAEYYVKARIDVPDSYPEKAVEVEDIVTNFPPLLSRHIVAQSQEIARRCVEPPLKKPKPNEPPFKPSASLEKVAKFLVDCVKRFPNEKCQVCKEQCLPVNPQEVETNESSSKHVERIYCGHLIHQSCLIGYMRTPPFSNKKCMACGKKIYHEKWGLSDHLAENRWAHEQARERELAEVEDFFK